MKVLILIALSILSLPVLVEAAEGYYLNYTIKVFKNKTVVRSENMRGWLTKDKSRIEFDDVVKLYRYDLRKYFVSDQSKERYHAMVPPEGGYHRDAATVKKTGETVKAGPFTAAVYKVQKSHAGKKFERIYHIAESPNVDLRQFYQWVHLDPGLVDIFGPFDHSHGLVIRVETTPPGGGSLIVHDYQTLEKVNIPDKQFATPSKIIEH